LGNIGGFNEVFMGRDAGCRQAGTAGAVTPAARPAGGLPIGAILPRWLQPLLRFLAGPVPPWTGVVLLLAVLAWLAVDGLKPGLAGRAPAGSVDAVPALVRTPEPVAAVAAALPDPATTAATGPPATPRGQVGLVLAGLGLDPALSRAASDLPAAIALAWSPYGGDPRADPADLRRRGREIWLDLPVSRGDPGRFDAGPLALSPARADDRNLQRLDMALAAVADPVGVVAQPGAYAAAPRRMRPLAAALARLRLPLLLHGDFARMVAAEAGGGAWAVEATMPVSTLASAIDRFLQELAARAERSGSALGVMVAHPLIIERLSRWSWELAERGLTLVPPSMLLRAADGRAVAAMRATPANGGVASRRDGG
jgi:polysaccharide deacetylase 2 family uncharacterized protein YibQ